MSLDNSSLRSPLVKTTLVFFGIALICTVFADIAITTVDPWRELTQLLLGIVTPDFYATENLGSALLYTLAFALLGVAFGNVFGLVLALLFASRIVRLGTGVASSAILTWPIFPCP